MHTPKTSTTAAVTASHKKEGSWRKLALRLGYEGAFAVTLSNVARRKKGAISTEAERLLRTRLGLSNYRRIDEMPADLLARAIRRRTVYYG